MPATAIPSDSTYSHCGRTNTTQDSPWSDPACLFSSDTNKNCEVNIQDMPVFCKHDCVQSYIYEKEKINFHFSVVFL